MKDDHGHRLQTFRDKERHQCRVCLKLTEPGERVLSLAYSPFDRDTAYSEVGPIFIHERHCTPHRPEDCYPAEFPRHDVVLRAYNEEGKIEDAELVGERVVEEVIGELLDQPRVRFIHARNSTYGCYMFRIDRSSRSGKD